ncbi:Ataxin-3 [Rhizoctonia solani AG-1 IB]|uniref:ubiquitinyl hydrolase 1 n=1 Tax=Thanatephorus cucumeris (strain AG1-IB / isolate 7/3/14) TaxID=1108050 RepID=M5BWG1_THACB|nr:Ataxin-3 [Rhizoctonia solani AG-1 IB]
MILIDNTTTRLEPSQQSMPQRRHGNQACKTKKTIGNPSSHSGTSHVYTSQATLPTTGPPATPDLRVHTPHSKLAKTDLPTAIAFITTVRPYVEPYVEPLLWRGVSWVLGDAERPGDAVREVERWKEQQSERERTVMQGLGPYIYHERQEPGSMMCGQHALNSMLQGNYFTPPDLAQIAHEIDQLEQGVRDSRGGRSTNMDDTGYFSVQVLENALKNAFGLTLVRWRSEEMRPYQAVPDTQLGFVLNLEQHWFTLRRFGHPKRKGHWFNLNSFLQSPEWVGSTYLGMVLQQAEKEADTYVKVTRSLSSVLSILRTPNTRSPKPKRTSSQKRSM